MFTAIFIAVIAALIMGGVYLVIRTHDIVLHKFTPKTTKGKILSWILAVIPVGLLVLWSVIRPYYGGIFLLHLIIFMLITDGVSAIVGIVRKNKVPHYVRAIFAICITVAYMGTGYLIAHHVFEKHYKVDTDKNVTPLRVAMIADCHVGALFDGKGFADYMKDIEKCEPDVLLISGDFVDDDTKRSDMIESCKALGQIKTTYGVFYANGNHDKGYSGYRDFDYDDLISELEKNGVIVLEDEIYSINDDYTIVGRKDQLYDRYEINDLMNITDSDKYSIVLDHRPTDYDAEVEASCDMVLSGHTHGGQLFPIGQIAVLLGINDKNYGMEKRGNTTFIVTSGLGDWAIPYKTFCTSEYCIIDIS